MLIAFATSIANKKEEEKRRRRNGKRTRKTRESYVDKPAPEWFCLSSIDSFANETITSINGFLFSGKRMESKRKSARAQVATSMFALN